MCSQSNHKSEISPYATLRLRPEIGSIARTSHKCIYDYFALVQLQHFTVRRTSTRPHRFVADRFFVRPSHTCIYFFRSFLLLGHLMATTPSPLLYSPVHNTPHTYPFMFFFSSFFFTFSFLLVCGCALCARGRVSSFKLQSCQFGHIRSRFVWTNIEQSKRMGKRVTGRHGRVLMLIFIVSCLLLKVQSVVIRFVV